MAEHSSDAHSCHVVDRRQDDGRQLRSVSPLGQERHGEAVDEQLEDLVALLAEQGLLLQSIYLVKGFFAIILFLH